MKFILFLFILILCQSCTRPSGDVIRFGLAAAPVTLDPRFATDAESTRINRLLYQRLVDFNRELLPVPALAKWKMLSPRHYRFALKDERAPFHNSKRLNAYDVEATYRFILDEKNASPHRGTLKLIEDINVLDEKHLDFKLSKADPLFPGYLVIGILPRELITAKHPFQTRPVGSGEFRFIAWPESGKLRLQRIADSKQFEFITVKEPVVRVLKLLRGELDMLQNGLPPELIAWLEQRKDIHLHKGRGSNFTYLGFNLEDPVTGRLPVRQAIARAIDREELIRYMLGKAARPAQALLPPDHWAGHPALENISYTPEKAAQLLEQAGFNPAQPARISYKTSNNPFRVRLATVLKNQLEKVGFQVDLRSYDWGTFYSDIKSGRFQMYSLSWVGIKTPDIFHYVFHSSTIPPNGANRGRFRDAEADALIDQAMQTTDLHEQSRLYQKLQTRLLEQLPYVPLWYEDHVLVTRSGIQAYQPALDGNYDGLRETKKN